MFGVNWKVSERKFQIRCESGVSIPISDGIYLDADIFRPDVEGKFPAILGVHAYSMAPQTEPIFPRSFGYMNNEPQEAGDPRFFVRRGYAQVVLNVRGTGKSGGHYQHYGPREVKDTYEAIEWIANQPWCDGNVGMFGVSMFAIVQKQVATLKPPHLKAIFAPYGYTDFYRDKFYHGGILNHAFMKSWSGHLDNMRYKSIALQQMGEERFHTEIQKLLSDRDIHGIPYLVDALKRALKHPEGPDALITDILVNPTDSLMYQERNVDYSNLDVPIYTGGCWGIYGLHLAAAFRDWLQVKHSNKKLVIGPPAYLDRPLYQYQFEALRWFDYWLKGIENGIMAEPPVRLFVMGTGQWKESTDWPLPETKWTPFYLHTGQLLSEHEFWPNESADTLFDSPGGRGEITYTSPKLVEDTEVIGPIILKLFASSSDTEVLWFVSLWDINPEGHEKLLTRGWLRGTLREVDKDKSTDWEAFHPFDKYVPVNPEEVHEYVINLVSTGNLFSAGHKIALKIKCADDDLKPTTRLETIGVGHLGRQSSSVVSVYHDENHPSCLFLPVTKGNLVGTFISGGDPLPLPTNMQQIYNRQI